MSKVFIVGEIVENEENLGGDERLQEIFNLPADTFEPPKEKAPVENTVAEDDDKEFVNKLRSAFTTRQARHYPAVRNLVFRFQSWRRALAEINAHGWVTTSRGVTDHAQVDLPAWFTENDARFRAQGRTFLLAVAYIEKALTNLGTPVTLEDHSGHMGDDHLDNMVKDLIESDDNIRTRTSFGRRGELVIVSKKQLESLIAR